MLRSPILSLATLAACTLTLSSSSPARAGFITPTCGSSISSSVTLFADIVCPDGFNGTALTIAADNVTINGNGHTLRVNGLNNTTNAGIRASGRNNLEIRGLTITDTALGIGMSDSSAVRIIDNTMTQANTAIQLIAQRDAAQSIVITGNTLTSGGAFGVNLTDLSRVPASAINVNNNVFTGRASGIFMSQVSGLTFPTTNTFDNVGKTFFQTLTPAILLSQASDIVFNGLTLNSNDNGGQGLVIDNGTRITIRNMTINGHADAMVFGGTSTNYVVTDNNLDNNQGRAINFTGTVAGTLDISDNSAVVGDGAALTVSSFAGFDINRLTLENNDFSGRGAGIALNGITGPWAFPTSNDFTNTGRTFFAVNFFPAIQLSNASAVTFTGLSLQSDRNDGIGLRVFNGTDIVIDDNAINGHANAIEASGTTTDGRITDNDLTGTSGVGILVSNPAVDDDRFIVSGNELPNGDGVGIQLSDCSAIDPAVDLVLEDNNLNGRGSGLNIGFANDWTLPTSNDLRGAGRTFFAVNFGAAITIASSRNVVVTGLDLTGITNQGIGLRSINSPGMTVTNNTITNRTSAVILAGTLDGVRVAGNTMTNTLGNAIELNGSLSTGGLVLDDNAIASANFGAQMNVTGPGAIAITNNDFTGSANGLRLGLMDTARTIDLATNVFTDVAPQGRVLSIEGSTGTTVQNLRGDCSGTGTLAFGINLQNVRLQNITACRRAIGVQLANAASTIIDGDFSGNGVGIVIDAASTNTSITARFIGNGTDIDDDSTTTTTVASAMPDTDGDGLGDACDPPTFCGNGEPNDGEGCDDGNLVDGDGCNSNCLIEAGFTCFFNSQCENTDCDEQVCGGAHDVLTVQTHSDVVAGCTAGGTLVETGADNGAGTATADDGILDDAEVESFFVVCDGTDGTNGTDGANGSNGVDGTNGADGAAGAEGPAGPGGCAQGGGAGVAVPLALVALLRRRRRAA